VNPGRQGLIQDQAAGLGEEQCFADGEHIDDHQDLVHQFDGLARARATLCTTTSFKHGGAAISTADVGKRKK